ncbi:hypothetical protein GOP47_0003130 [Adiantum capillus-veneris]|uniref:Uncharacterized protein n=1 Tax=Adiantum capillus-veneris TaxID=13818 RepID=A0A9D4VBX0_ADICA|nr:hypothetical protein GOP47_0003130 [Adiantum capillus-veneris]
MASFKITLSFPLLSLLIVFLLVHHANAQFSPAPAPPPTSDGTSIDLGIAYALMFVALAVTYLLHPIDAFPFNLF